MTQTLYAHTNIIKKEKKILTVSWVLMAHACNLPSYLAGRDQEDRSSQPAQANSSRDPISKKPFTKIGLLEWLKMKSLNSSPSTTKRKKKKMERKKKVLTMKAVS
jgi:hypothetical protein